MDITDLLIDMDDGSPKFHLLCLRAYMCRRLEFLGGNYSRYGKCTMHNFNALKQSLI